MHPSETNEQPDFTSEQKAKARRTIVIISLVMVVLMVLPFVVMVLKAD